MEIVAVSPQAAAPRRGAREAMVEGSSQEARRRSGDLRRLAAEFNVSLDELTRLYDVDLNELTSAARIRTFLPVLVTRRLERALRRRSRAKQNRSTEKGSTAS